MFRFPFGTLQELNLDWIINKLHEFAETGTKTPEPLTIELADGTSQEFDGSEAVTIDLAGADVSGKLDKYTGVNNTVYGTLNGVQVNYDIPLPIAQGGTSATNAADARTTLGAEATANKDSAIATADESSTSKYPSLKGICDWVKSKFVAKLTTTGASAYGHSGSTEEEYPVRVNVEPASIPYRDANGCVKTGTPSADADSATKKYVDDSLLGEAITLTLATGFTNQSGRTRAYRVGNMVYAFIGVQGSALPAATNVLVATIDSTLVPGVVAFGNVHSNEIELVRAQIGTTGEIFLRSETGTSGAFFYGELFWKISG